MPNDHELALELATASGRLLLELRAELGFGNAHALRAAGDARSHDLLMSRFAAQRPGDAVLSEEGADDKARLIADRVWIVDPLDGTREYGEPGRTDWAVHVALWERGRGLTAGAVTLPGRGQAISTGIAPAPVSPPYEGRPRIVVSRSRAPEWVAAVAGELGAEVVLLGSAGAKIAAVVTGEAEAYLHAGGQYEWDSAAPVAVAQAAGVWCSRLDGSPLSYNEDDPSLPDLLVARADLVPRLLAAVAAHA